MAEANLKIKGTFSQVTIEPDSTLGYRGTQAGTDGAPGQANKTTLTDLFSGSPLVGYENKEAKEIKVAGISDPIDMSSPESYKAWFIRNVVNGTITDSSFGLVEFDRDYNESPDLATVETGPSGLPATPFVPNPVSPGEGVVSPTAMEEAPKTFSDKQTSSAPFGGPNTTDDGKVTSGRNPSTTAQEIKGRLT